MSGEPVRVPYVPPPYPYDRLQELKAVAEALPGGLVDLSIGTPFDAPPERAVQAFATAGSSRGYPPSIGLPAFREAVVGWFERNHGVALDVPSVAATIGSKEFVVTTPRYLHLRRPDRDTVLYPAISYPSYAMGAELAGLRAVPVPVNDNWQLRLDAIDPADAARALALWVNSPGNPAGSLDDLAAAAAWGRTHDVTVLSDECYIEFTWEPPVEAGRRPGRTVLEHGLDGVIAVHSLSKRSNFAGARVGFYAGDRDLVWYLSEIRKHSGNMVPGPVQHGAIAALGDNEHVDSQRGRYRRRLELMAGVLTSLGLEARMPAGGFYLWVAAPGGDAWALTEQLARLGGVLVSPGEFYGPAGSGHVRLALVQPPDRLELVAERLAGASLS